ncbi:MAG TPA: arylsulfotransferase family protein, partial [Acidimicrobiales bacterium]|nr:arylsulfotransferase family protein [Acidimicrobiales bacterium]
ATAPSRGLVLHLDMATHVASVVRHYSLGASDDSAYMGSEQILPDGNVFVGWGSLPYFTEFSASGRLLLQATLPGPDLSYRATAISSWVGEPTSPPSARVLVRGGKATVYVSWNGATQVVLWEVRAGDSTSSLKTVATSSRTGFETAIGLPSDARVVEVEALDAEGNVLGRAVAKG